ncbi:hypothetical protein [Cognatishimia sp. F0-27]|nr:hypothetical protein [Cognatishimia sp. F0-27]MCC1492579.1 hypothetical protein [Cognatishimia sp. F0-27]
MKPITIVQAIALLILAVIGVQAEDPAAGACPLPDEAPTASCDLVDL